MRRDCGPDRLRMFNSWVGLTGIRQRCSRAPRTGLHVQVEIAMKEQRWQSRQEALQVEDNGLDAIGTAPSLPGCDAWETWDPEGGSSNIPVADHTRGLVGNSVANAASPTVGRLGRPSNFLPLAAGQQTAENGLEAPVGRRRRRQRQRASGCRAGDLCVD